MFYYLIIRCSCSNYCRDNGIVFLVLQCPFSPVPNSPFRSLQRSDLRNPRSDRPMLDVIRVVIFRFISPKFDVKSLLSYFVVWVVDSQSVSFWFVCIISHFPIPDYRLSWCFCLHCPQLRCKTKVAKIKDINIWFWSLVFDGESNSVSFASDL